MYVKGSTCAGYFSINKVKDTSRRRCNDTQRKNAVVIPTFDKQ